MPVAITLQDDVRYVIAPNLGDDARIPIGRQHSSCTPCGRSLHTGPDLREKLRICHSCAAKIIELEAAMGML